MLAIIKKEIKTYFTSAVGYVILSLFYFFAGLFFALTCLATDSSDLSGVFSLLFLVVLFLIPLLTMRLLSEEKKHKTDQALLTAPITVTQVVLGKYLAAVLMFLCCMSITLIFALVVSFFVPLNVPLFFCNFFGLFLLGAALIALCLFLSSFTENQIIAALLGFAASLLLILLAPFSNAVSTPWVSKFTNSISFMNKYGNFTSGIVKISDIVFFISVCVLFVFFCARTLEKRKWS